MKKVFKVFLIAIVMMALVIQPVLANDKDSMANHSEAITEENEKAPSIRDEFSGRSIYPITPDDKKWEEFTSKKEMLDACRISQDILDEMTTDELIKAVLDFPLVINLYLYNSYEDGLEALEEESDAFKELLKRSDANEKLSNILNASNSNRMSFSSIESSNDSLDLVTLKILQSKIDKSNLSKQFSSIKYVKTPKGSKVKVKKRGELLNDEQRDIIKKDVKKKYPRATYVSKPTTNYNCHSYAWYKDSTSNKYWMDNPKKYMTDGSYKIISYTEAKKGTIVHYPMPKGTHSAIVYRSSGSINNAKKLYVISKWGMGPLMKHYAGYGPYNSNHLTVWKEK
ncbi:hypothetical protein [Wukongibacter sp. M2B1]|uniref:hypothetical protein n=1 Tax=Wukongibacter sp. M2B1 TaxID=3088895 RepID=UPI003D7BCD70